LSGDDQRFLVNNLDSDVAPAPVMLFVNWLSALKK